MSCIILSPDADSVRRAADALKQGKLVALPTETVYGLGANALDDLAVAEIYAAKGRPSFNPLIVHLASRDQAEHYAEFTPLARALADVFWPGPLTLVIKRKDNCPLSHLVSAGLDTVALRVPAHPTAQALLSAGEVPIAAPSANRSGRISPTRARHVLEEFQSQAELLILDGGACAEGLESTVVDATGKVPILLRPGSITADDITSACGQEPVRPVVNTDAPPSPGMLLKHYAPTIPLRMNATSFEADEALLAFGPCPHHGGTVLNLSPTGNLKEASANLFAYLRELDKPEHNAIAVMPIPETGLGLAINDRLRRAEKR